MGKQDAEAAVEKIGRKQAGRIVGRYRVTNGSKFRLKDYDPADTASYSFDRDQATELLARGVAELADQQEKLHAQNRWSVLCVFQAMDAAGKDGTIKHVMSGVNPQGVRVTSFKAPGPEDLAHDFMWRIWRALPERGQIGIFNRSHYEEVLVARVHPAVIERQRLPEELVSKRIWKDRLASIAAIEEYLAQQGTVILKFFLNVSHAEQKRRFIERLDEPAKNWKFSPGDISERSFWNDYMSAYQDAIAGTAAPHAPWHVVPADNKWFTRLVVVATIVDALRRLDLDFPKLGEEEHVALAAARARLALEDA
jgi:PPK2 family polyphosphate:nucleotide phosphotransferase